MFFASGFHPSYLPDSCLSIAPHFDKLNISQHRRPLHENNNSNNVNNLPTRTNSEIIHARNHPGTPSVRFSDRFLSTIVDLKNQISVVIESCNNMFSDNMDEAEDPASVPIYWVSKWVDYSDKYGFGYQLCDNSHGSLFNDHAQLILFSHEKYFFEKKNCFEC